MININTTYNTSAWYCVALLGFKHNNHRRRRREHTLTATHPYPEDTFSASQSIQLTRCVYSRTDHNQYVIWSVIIYGRLT